MNRRKYSGTDKITLRDTNTLKYKHWEEDFSDKNYITSSFKRNICEQWYFFHKLTFRIWESFVVSKEGRSAKFLVCLFPQDLWVWLSFNQHVDIFVRKSNKKKYKAKSWQLHSLNTNLISPVMRSPFSRYQIFYHSDVWTQDKKTKSSILWC